ncbi:cell wall protein DAN4-like [Xenopus laevis]|uniref:Cell wall protein DAN4-like n=1 Tax=Xenopus laevis TaxID=8355 RepID=A0A8J0VN80_XENLA|nr:cell wall protein DAN4-like [Xenopus laevis]
MTHVASTGTTPTTPAKKFTTTPALSSISTTITMKTTKLSSGATSETSKPSNTETNKTRSLDSWTSVQTTSTTSAKEKSDKNIKTPTATSVVKNTTKIAHSSTSVPITMRTTSATPIMEPPNIEANKIASLDASLLEETTSKDPVKKEPDKAFENRADLPAPMNTPMSTAVLSFQSDDPMDSTDVIQAIVKKVCSMFPPGSPKGDITLTWGQDRTSVNCASVM